MMHELQELKSDQHRAALPARRHWRRKVFRRALIGACAGFLATAPMTVFMKLGHRTLPRREQYPLPPRVITMNVSNLAGVTAQMDEKERSVATMTAHFGYGTAMGAVYAVARGHSAHPPSGMAYGLSVWAGSYLGVLPACGLLNSATEHPVRRTALMVAAHVVWGCALGFLTRELSYYETLE